MYRKFLKTIAPKNSVQGDAVLATQAELPSVTHDPIPSDDAARWTTSITDVPATSDDRLLITLEARGREKFDALFNGKRIVQAGSQPICDAARILHRLGHDDDVLLVATFRRKIENIMLAV